MFFKRDINKAISYANALFKNMKKIQSESGNLHNYGLDGLITLESHMSNLSLTFEEKSSVRKHYVKKCSYFKLNNTNLFR